MKSESLMKFYKYCAATLATIALSAQGAVLLTENFDNVSALGATGWVVNNSSTPTGTTSWFQGTSEFPAQSGAPNSYIAANFNNTDPSGGTLINTLFTPQVYIANGISLTFWTRTDVDPDNFFSDRLRVLYSASGASTNLAVFTPLLVINPTLATGGYPQQWTQFSVTVAGNTTAGPGRFALQYNVPLVDGAQSPVFANFIGIDTVTVSSVPNPASWLLFALGLSTLALTLKRARNKRVALVRK
jgi:hypothetical protein